MVEKQGPENSEGSLTQPNSAQTNADVGIGGNVEGNVTVGNNNVVNNNIVNNYYQQEVKKNIEKHEPDYWALKHPYPMPPNFTGRIAERALLTHWLKEDSENRLFILRALGGFGKSALSWQWLTHDVDIKEFPKVLWWSFYEGDASFEHFIEETLKYLKIEVPQGQRPQVDALLKAMQSQKILLIMDGFERALRAYSSMNAAYQGDEPKVEDNQLDCVNINAEIFLKSVCSLPNIKSKVLMTTRLTPRAVKPRGEFLLGCREEELTSMQPTDAVEFFRKQKIKGTYAEIDAACAPYGYHPLSLRILARKILRDFDKPADIVIAQKYKIDGDLKAQRHHILEVAYNSLAEQEQKSLSTIACFRSPVEFKTLETIVENKDSLDNDLHDLIDSGLLNFDEKNKRFDLHPIVRRYTYDRLTATDRTAAHIHLIDYFEAITKLEKVEKLEDLSPVIEFYYHTARARKLDEAATIYYKQLQDPIFFQFGAYQLGIELLSILFSDGDDRPPTINRSDIKEWALNELGRLYARVGQSYKSILLREMHNRLLSETRLSIFNETANSEIKISLSSGMGNLAVQELAIGRFKDTEKHLYQGIILCDGIYHPLAFLAVAIRRSGFGYLLSYCGMWSDALQELKHALEQCEKLEHVQMQGSIWSDVSLFNLLHNRSTMKESTGSIESAIMAAQQALYLADKDARTDSPTPRDYIRAYWLLGAAYRANNELTLAEENLSKALNLCRQINLIDHEADILLDLARLRNSQKNYEEAKNLADEALLITERCGYVLQGADVNLFLAQYVLEQEQDKARAKEYAETALKLATCDGPPYYYKVAYEEAERMLGQL